MPSKPLVAKNSRSTIILTALDVETRATLRHLTGVHEEVVRGGTVFHVGQFRQWAVAVAECGEGNVPAATTAERGINHFRPEVALFVGVAGGVKDVTIGDAVVSTKIYGYERGKDVREGLKPRPEVNLSAHALEQRARAVRLKDDWKQRLNSELKHSKPQIYIGAIAAGEKVVASRAGKIARFLKEHYGDALAVEMEGQGFLAGVHINAPVEGCVIRGISDLLNGKAHADKAGSQERAADVASAVAFEMLATLKGQAKRNGNGNVIASGMASSPPPLRTEKGGSLLPGQISYIPIRLGRDGLVEVSVKSIIPDWTGYSPRNNTPELSLRLISGDGSLSVERQLGISAIAAREFHAGPVTISIYNFEANPPVTFEITMSYPQ